MPGTIRNLFIKPGAGLPMRPADIVDMVASKGIEGDAAYGRNRRQILIVDTAVLEGFQLHPGDLRENITLSGMNLQEVAPGSLLHIGETTLLVQGECTPCSKMDAVKPGLQTALQEQRGILASVLQSGSIKVGDRVTLTPPQN